MSYVCFCYMFVVFVLLFVMLVSLLLIVVLVLFVLFVLLACSILLLLFVVCIVCIDRVACVASIACIANITNKIKNTNNSILITFNRNTYQSRLVPITIYDCLLMHIHNCPWIPMRRFRFTLVPVSFYHILSNYIIFYAYPSISLSTTFC